MGEQESRDLLRLVGFEEHELAVFIPEWNRAAEKLGLTEEDVRFATETWIPQHFEVELRGIRQLLSAMIKEAIDLTKAWEYKQKGVKIVYGILPAIIHYYYALKLTAPDKVYVSFPDIFVVTVLNSFFHKLNPYLEEAEKSGISYGCRHCALNKTRLSLRKLDVIPSPDISWIWGFICDEAPKTEEYIRLYCDPQWNYYATLIPHDQAWGTVEDEEIERVEYLASQMRDGFEFVQKEVGIRVSNEKIKEVANTWRRYSSKLLELYQLMASDPQPLSGEAGALLGLPLFTPFNTGLRAVETALDTTIEEVKQRISNRIGILPPGAPKLMFNYIPFCLPWIVKMFEQSGVGVPYFESFLPSRKILQPSRFADPYMDSAETWLKRSISVNPGYKAEIISEKLKLYPVDGMVFGFFDFDRWLGSDNKLMAKVVAEKTGLPTFYIEGDLWEDRDYSPGALRTRIETIAEIVKMRKRSV